MSVDLKVRISTVGELAGAKAVEAQLERQIGQAKALGKEYSHLAEQLDRVRKVQAAQAAQQQANQSFANKTAGDAADPTANAAAISRYTAQAGAATAASVGFAGALGRVWGGLRMIAFIIPGLGIAGLIGGLVAGVAWLAKLVIGTDNTKKALEDLAEKIKTVKESFDDSAVAHAEFQQGLARIKADTKTAKDELEAYTTALGQYFDDLQKVADAEKELALARAERITDTGEREARKLEITQGASDASGDLAKRRAAAIREAKDIALLNTSTDAQNRADQLDAQIAAREGELKNISAKAAVSRQNRDRLEAEAKAAEEKAGGLLAMPSDRAAASQLRRQANFEASEYQRSIIQGKGIGGDLRSLQQEREAVQRTLVNTDPAALAAAQARLISPINARAAVSGVGAVAGRVAAIGAETQRTRAVTELDRERTAAEADVTRREEALRKAATDLSRKSSQSISVMHREVEVARRNLDQIIDAIRRLNSQAGSNSRLD